MEVSLGVNGGETFAWYEWNVYADVIGENRKENLKTKNHSEYLTLENST